MESINYIEVDTVASTNDHLKKLAINEELPEGFVIWAKNQTQGRGQGGNKWESAPGKNLTFSILFRPKFLEPSNMFLMSKIVSLGIVDYLNSLDRCFTIKWPNDIYYCNKKVAGILIENQLMGNVFSYSLAGIGINVNQTKFKSDAPNPISLSTILNKDLSLHQTLSGVINQINIWFEMLADGHIDKINQQYFAHLFRNADYHDFTWQNKTIHAKIKSVDNDGRLNLKTPEGEIKSFYFKEVEFVI